MASPLPRDETPLVPDMEPGASSLGSCGNCDAALSGPYCAQCGEKKITPRDYTLAHVTEETLDVFTSFDSKFFRTLKVLFTKPGELSNAYFRGGRSRYTKPLTVFVVINVIFFIVQPHTGLLRYKYADYLGNPSYLSRVRTHLLETKEPEATYAARFDANLQNQKKSLLIVSVPLLALAMALLLRGTGRTYAEHLVFSVQVYAFLLSYLAAMVFVILFPLGMLFKTLGPRAALAIQLLGSELGISILTITAITTYVYLGLRRAYAASRVRAAVSAFLMAWVVALLTGVYHNALFFATFFTT